MDFLDNLESLVTFLKALIKTENDYCLTNHRVKFMTSDDLIENMFSSNPVIDTPPRPHYVQQFKSAILPEILRRSVSCPQSLCSPMENGDREIAVRDTGNLNSLLLADQLRICSRCNRRDAMLLIANDNPLTDEASSIVNVIAPAQPESAYLAFDHVEVFPTGNEPDRLSKLNAAVRIYVEAAAIGDRQWVERPVSNIAVADEFWQSLLAADFRDLRPRYIDRICRSLGQLASGLNLDISAHRMVNQSFGYDGRSLGKWNAYVFQMGASDQDTRCSRIYYGFGAGGIVLFRYEPDAHP